MSEEPLTPAEAARALWLLDQEADRTRAELKLLRKKIPGLNKAYVVTRARAFLESEGPIEVRKNLAILAAADALFQKEACEQEMEACREHIFGLKDRAENVRAINSNLKEEIRGLGGRYDGHP
jgi:hypothetical protein